MSLPQENEKAEPWIRRHLTGYLIGVFILDLQLFGLILADEIVTKLTGTDLTMFVYHALVFVNIVPAACIFAKWINSKCVGHYYPIKLTSLIAVAGTMMLIFAFMTESYASSLPYPELPVKPEREFTRTILIPEIHPNGVLQIIKSHDIYWQAISEKNRQDAIHDPIGYVNGHPFVFSWQEFSGLTVTVSTTNDDYEEQIEEWEKSTPAIRDQIELRDSTYNLARLIGAFGTVFLIGGVVGSIAMFVIMSFRSVQ